MLQHKTLDMTEVEVFQATIARLRQRIDDKPSDAHDVNAALREINDVFLNIEFDDFDMAELEAVAADLLVAIFELRMALRGHLPEWQKRWHLSANGQKLMRETFRITRYATDMLGEIAIRFESLPSDEQPYQSFTGDKINTLINPAYDTGRGVQFHSGDVLLMRGSAHNSAAIARIGDMDSQFSHLGIIYVDEDRRIFVVEALIEYGAVITPMEEAFNHGLVRAVLLRHKDAELARQAAAHIHARIASSVIRDETRILYDFSMEPEGYKTLFCSKLVRQAYDEASGGAIKLPTYMTRIEMKNRDFLDRIGVTAKDTFAPGDMEIEPDFGIVAEWRDYRATAKVRIADLTMDKLFEWMETHDYRFEEDYLIWLISKMGRSGSTFSVKAKRLLADVMPIVPPNMPRKTVAVVAMLHKTAEPIVEHLLALEQKHISDTGRPLHPRSIFAELEKIRQSGNGQLGYLRVK